MNDMICDEECKMEMETKEPSSDSETVETKATTCSSDVELEDQPNFHVKSLSMGDIAGLGTTTAKPIDVGRSVSLPPEMPSKRRSSIMSVRTLEESLKDDSPYLEAARQRRLHRKSASIASSKSPQDAQKLVDESLVKKDDLSVSFHSIEIREFAIQIGDNPSVSSGPPLTIDWDHFNEEKIDIDTYEDNLPPRRNSATMIIPARQRYEMLIENTNLSRGQISEVTKKVAIAKHNRCKTTAMLEMDQLVYAEEKIEKLRRGVRNLMNKERKRKEKEMIRAALESDRRERERRLAVDSY